MLALVIQNLRHIVRTRLLLTLLAFSFLIQFVGLRGLQYMTFRFQGIVRTMGDKDALFAALFFQLFTGAFVAAAYGIWMVPYSHQGPRSPLTYTLPVPRWFFPVSYGISMLILLLLQHVVLVASFAINFGFDAFLSGSFPWKGFFVGLCLETLAFEALLFAFALSSMVLGQIPTFFMGALMIFFLQISGAVFRFDFESIADQTPPSLIWAKWLYEKLPPVGELVFDLRQTFRTEQWSDGHFGAWLVWLLIFVALFQLKLRYPQRQRPGEA